MAILNLDYYRGADLYSDGDVENEILEIVKSGRSFETMKDARFPVLYHLSRIRENILNWYPFKAGAAGLEIGAGCGAITGLLCSRLSKVVSAELSRRRADINFARHKEYSNLEIWVGNLNDMEFGRKFDYIIINGVFEYAMSFTGGEHPYETFLANIRQFLKPDGVILVAIENRLGLKYFAGAPEDHTDGYFDGIREYEGNQSVRTFSRGEWERLMHICGFDYYKFYYPYPDYKFPKEIFTDESLKEQKYGCPAWNFTKYRMALFEETKMASTLQSEGIMGHFANSFLIEMSRVPLKLEHNVLYAKLSTDRDSRFSIATVIEERETEVSADTAKGQRGRRAVVKRPMTEAAGRHLQRMLEQMEDYGSWRPLEGWQEGAGIVYPFLDRKSLAYQAELAVREKDRNALKHLVDQVAGICAGAKDSVNCRLMKGRDIPENDRIQFRRVFGSDGIMPDLDCIAPANIDLILNNIFEADGKYEVIDCEWVFDFPVPAAFILWRTINELYANYPHLETVYAKNEFYEAYGITAEMSGVFWKWATYFAESYVGANRLLHRSIPEIGVSLEEFRQKIRSEECAACQLFVDTGKGFSEDEKLVEEMELSKRKFSVTFRLKNFEHVRALRFDPLEGRPCVCRIDREKTTADLQAANAAARTEQGDLFLTTDPIYHVNMPDRTDCLTISGELEILQAEDALERAGRLLQKRGGRLAFWKRH